MQDGFARTYGVELLLEAAPQISKADLLAALRRHGGNVEPLDGNPASDLLSFVYPDHPVVLGGKAMPAQTFFAVANKPIDSAKLEPALQQTWNWPDARAVVSRAHATLLVTDLMSSSLDYKERLALLQNAVSAALDIVPAVALHWQPSQCLADPRAYQEARQPATSIPLFPALNVRLFNINNGAPGESLMDTMGLAALGLPDIQCHFTDLDVTSVAQVLYNAGAYLFDNGDIIKDGETIQGITASDHWRCQHEDALLAPARVVLDLNPGKLYAAGSRA